MQLKAADVFRVSCVGRAVEVTGEVLDPLHIVMLGLLSRDNLDETGATIWVRRGGRVK
jgi:hypothetical protein